MSDNLRRIIAENKVKHLEKQHREDKEDFNYVYTWLLIFMAATVILAIAFVATWVMILFI